MRFSIAAAAAGLAGVAAAQGSWPQGGSGWPASNGTGPAYVTEVVTAFTTYCPAATMITHNSVTYTVTSATTLTITNCPCTVTKPVSSSVYTSCPASTGAPPPYSSGKPAPPQSGPVGTASTGAPSAPISSPTSSPITPAKGDSSRLTAGAAGVLAMVGLIAAL